MDAKTLFEQLKEKRNVTTAAPTANKVDPEKLAAFMERLAKLREKAKEKDNAEK